MNRTWHCQWRSKIRRREIFIHVGLVPIANGCAAGRRWRTRRGGELGCCSDSLPCSRLCVAASRYWRQTQRPELEAILMRSCFPSWRCLAPLLEQVVPEALRPEPNHPVPKPVGFLAVPICLWSPVVWLHFRPGPKPATFGLQRVAFVIYRVTCGCKMKKKTASHCPCLARRRGVASQSLIECYLHDRSGRGTFGPNKSGWDWQLH